MSCSTLSTSEKIKSYINDTTLVTVIHMWFCILYGTSITGFHEFITSAYGYLFSVNLSFMLYYLSIVTFVIWTLMTIFVIVLVIMRSVVHYGMFVVIPMYIVFTYATIGDLLSMKDEILPRYLYIQEQLDKCKDIPNYEINKREICKVIVNTYITSNGTIKEFDMRDKIMEILERH